MSAICFYFQVHQPYRLRKYRIFDIGHTHEYFSDASDKLDNRQILQKVARKSYLPTNKILLGLLQKHPGFKISFSLSGVVLEQLADFSPETLASFMNLAATGRAEILSETYYHSLSYLYSKTEFQSQVNLHSRKIKSIFGQTPKIFRNTELIYNNDLASDIARMGYKGILCEGADHILGWRSPNFLYHPPGNPKTKLLLKNYRLSDDIAFRFSSKEWADYPLTAPKFASWVSAVNGSGDIVNLFMDYETFGEHQWEDTGIFEFLRHLPGELLKHPDNYFVTPSEAVKKLPAVGELDIPHYMILKTKDPRLIDDWRKLQTSDHFYYMCTKWFSDGDVHKYFNPYESPYEAFISFMNILQDLKLRLPAQKVNSKIFEN